MVEIRGYRRDDVKTYDGGYLLDNVGIPRYNHMDLKPVKHCTQ